MIQDILKDKQKQIDSLELEFKQVQNKLLSIPIALFGRWGQSLYPEEDVLIYHEELCYQRLRRKRIQQRTQEIYRETREIIHQMFTTQNFIPLIDPFTLVADKPVNTSIVQIPHYRNIEVCEGIGYIHHPELDCYFKYPYGKPHINDVKQCLRGRLFWSA